jgi:importin subunit beta-1
LFEYAGKLRESIVEAYVGIVQGIKSGENYNCLSPYIPTVFGFLRHVGTHPERTESGIRSTLGLLGDLAETFPVGSMRQFFVGPNGSWIDPLIREVKAKKMGSATRDVSKWAREMIKRQV